MTQYVDFNFHDLFSIRLENPTTESVRAVRNQIGLQPSVFQGEPDLRVSYVDHFDIPLYYLVMESAGFTDHAFYIVTGSGHKQFLVQFPFGEVGGPCQIVCESGIGEIPLLKLVINLRMLTKGLMPIHASAFEFGGRGVVINGWPKGGKTSTLFSFLRRGATFVSDEWLYVDSSSKIYGLMQPIKLSDWQLRQLPEYHVKVKRMKRWMIQGLRWLDAVERSVPEWARENLLSARAFHQGVRYLNKKQRHVVLSPEKLFAANLEAPVGHFDYLLLTLSHESPEVSVNPLSMDMALERLMASLHYEWLKWEEYYNQYAYAFPYKRNRLMDMAWDKQRELLKQILANKQIFLVSHPHPVELDELYNAVSRILT